MEKIKQSIRKELECLREVSVGATLERNVREGCSEK
jgi:hypothetical protein